MANMFLGFPVPRARIADMIATTAPPAIHNTNHASGGSDQLDVTGLTGAGGVAFPLRGLWLDDYEADHARWTPAFTGSGALERNEDQLALLTDDTNPSTAKTYLKIKQPIMALSFDKKRHFLIAPYIDCDDRPTALCYMYTGDWGNTNHFGFEIHDSGLYGVASKSGGSSEVLLKTYEDAYIGDDLVLEAILYPGDRCDFYIAGVLEGSVNTNLPTGTDRADIPFFLKVDNQSTANNVAIEFSNVQCYQEA